ncbi:hypothetical protein C0991_004343 [Blastosporella zonata]|nr:hypothetical protein C0991_004343 [Blastosporella zonata]
MGSSAVVIPFRLSYFDVRRSLRTLFTPTERARPWTLYRTPGLLVAQLLKIAVSMPAFTSLRSLVFPVLRPEERFSTQFMIRFSVYVILVAFGASVIVPLDIITTRLAIQRNHASREEDTQDESVATAETELSVYSAEEDVIGLRDESDPYLSFQDCLKRIVHEEGRATLFRAWWVTFVPLLAAGMIQAGKKPGSPLA